MDLERLCAHRGGCRARLAVTAVSMKALVPPWFVRQYRALRRAAAHRVNRGRTAEDVFSAIYRDGLWGRSAQPFCSGSGSSERHAIAYVEALAGFIRRHA